MTDDVFDIAKLTEYGFIKRYDGKATWKKMKTAASYFSGDEKRGCHEIAVNNSGVVDCEIAFPGAFLMDDGTENKHGRVDLASLEEGEGNIQLVFWEAKDYGNSELRSAVRAVEIPPPVLTQLEEYQKYLAGNRETIVNSYTNVAKNLLSLKRMGADRELSPLIAEVAEGRRRLVMGKTPEVRLIIFGFDQAQRDHQRWKYRLQCLQESSFTVKAFGDAKGVKL